MINVAALVSQTSTQFSQEKVRVPLPILSSFTLFHRVHVIWRSYRKAKLYTNPDNFISLAAGHLVNYTIGDKLLVRISALCVLISKRILDVIRQIDKFQTSYGKLTSAIKGEFPTQIKFDSSKPPSFKSEAQYQYKKTVARIKQIAVALFRFLKDAFLLSMRMVDAIESFYLSPSTRNEGIQEMFVNSTKILDKLEKNQDKLYEGLEKNKPIIEKILKGINTNFPVDKFIQASEQTIRKTVSTYQKAKPTQNPQLRKLFHIPKKWLNDIVGGTFLASLVPESWKPMSRLEWDWLTLSRDPDRFPKKKRITKHSSLLHNQ